MFHELLLPLLVCELRKHIGMCIETKRNQTTYPFDLSSDARHHEGWEKNGNGNAINKNDFKQTQ